MRVILASGSEWRQRLLKQLGLSYEVKISEVDESVVECEEPDELVTELALLKMGAIVDHYMRGQVNYEEERTLAITADTVVYAGGEIIGKPKDKEDARRIIKILTQAPHEVWTGVCVQDIETGDKRVESVRTVVSFKEMSESEIERYLDTGDWKGKAGGYQIQKAILEHVVDIDGSVSNVIGLPLTELTEMLEDFGMMVETDVREVEETLLESDKDE